MKEFVDPKWRVGDATDLDGALGAAMKVPKGGVGVVDLVFTCPPYYNLEVYSEDPADISNCPDYATFLEMFETAMQQATRRLRPNRFAVLVVGDLRDKEGRYYGFVADTIKLMQNMGVPYYNEAVLVTAVGSLPVRVGKQFRSGRKLGKTHQNVLIFFKGDPKTIKKVFPATVEMADLAALLEPEDDEDGSA